MCPSIASESSLCFDLACIRRPAEFHFPERPSGSSPQFRTILGRAAGQVCLDRPSLGLPSTVRREASCEGEWVRVWPSRSKWSVPNVECSLLQRRVRSSYFSRKGKESSPADYRRSGSPHGVRRRRQTRDDVPVSDTQAYKQFGEFGRSGCRDGGRQEEIIRVRGTLEGQKDYCLIAQIGVETSQESICIAATAVGKAPATLQHRTNAINRLQ